MDDFKIVDDGDVPLKGGDVQQHSDAAKNRSEPDFDDWRRKLDAQADHVLIDEIERQDKIGSRPLVTVEEERAA